MSTRVRIATLIFHIRRRLAWNWFASHALGCRLGIGHTREFDPVERPSDQHDNNVRSFRRMRSSSNPRAMDARRGNVSCFGCNLADADAGWGPMGSAFAGNHWRRSGNVRTRFVVSRCSPFWMEAPSKRHLAKIALTLLKKPPPQTSKSLASKEGTFPPSVVCDFSRCGAVWKTQLG